MFHSLTGSDSESYFHRVGKIKVWINQRKLWENQNIFQQQILGIVKKKPERMRSTNKNFTSSPAHDSCTPAIKGAHYHAYVWNQCLKLLFIQSIYILPSYAEMLERENSLQTRFIILFTLSLFVSL